MNVALHEAGELQRRIDDLNRQRSELKPEPVNSKLQAQLDQAMKDLNAAQKVVDKAQQKVENLRYQVELEKGQKHGAACRVRRELFDEVAALIVARDALLQSAMSKPLGPQEVSITTHRKIT